MRTMNCRSRREAGSTLLSALLIMMLLSAMLMGFMAVVQSDQRAGFTNRDQTTSYAAAHAGLEQLTADLGELFATNYNPTGTMVNGLVGTPPTLNGGISFEAPGGGPGYQIHFDDDNGDGFPDPEDLNEDGVPDPPREIGSGPYQGLKGTVTPYEIEVTARTEGGSETRMRRTMQTVLIPAFQFGIFSENDLSFFAGPNFDFGGRVHTNSNLFLAEGNGNTLWLRDRVTAVGEVVRTNLSNGWLTSSNYTGTVRLIRYPGDTTGYAITTAQGSWSASSPQMPPAPEPGVIPSPGGNEPAWTTLSVSTTNGNIKNARTGARPLVLPLVQMGAEPIDLIRRPAAGSNEDTANAAVYGQRYYTRSSVRILLSDTAADITGLPGVTADAPQQLSLLANMAQAPPQPAGWWKTSTTNKYAAFSESGAPTAPVSENYWAPGGAWTPAGTPLVDGFIKIEIQRTNGVWVDVTSDILALGYTGRRLSHLSPGTDTTSALGPLSSSSYYYNDLVFGVPNNSGTTPTCATEPNPDAVIRLQRVRDDHNPLYDCGLNAGALSPNRFDFIPNVLYDPREGSMRDSSTFKTAQYPVALGGVMHYVELDVRNLVRWLNGTTGAGGFGPLVEFSDGGYVVYFSDRRTNQRVNGLETGEYGFEDFVNPAALTTLPNGQLDEGEDINGIDADNDGNDLDVYGQVPILPALRTSATANGTAVTTALRPWSTATMREARTNPPLHFRRALKLVNAAGAAATAPGSTVSPLTLLPLGRGLTVVAENPVYVQGNYNTGVGTGTSFGAAQTDHRPAAVIADAVTLLSNSWNDLRTFVYKPQNTATDCETGVTGTNPCFGNFNPDRRTATTTWYRMGIVAGKGLSFTKPSWASQDFGTDGGAHNFLRFVEDWGGQTLNYRGSIISFFMSRQGVGTYKCCENVYSPPTRGYRFDTEFLTMALLPPKSPAFRDVNTLTFRQLLRPTQ